MDTEYILIFLGWCSAINIGILLFWACFLILAPDWIYRWQCKWIAIPEERFQEIHFAMLGFFKLVIVFFNLVPYFALRIIG